MKTSPPKISPLLPSLKYAALKLIPFISLLLHLRFHDLDEDLKIKADTAFRNFRCVLREEALRGNIHAAKILFDNLIGPADGSTESDMEFLLRLRGQLFEIIKSPLADDDE